MQVHETPQVCSKDRSKDTSESRIYHAIQVDTYFLCKDTSVHGLITGWFQPVLNIISWSLFHT